MGLKFYIRLFALFVIISTSVRAQVITNYAFSASQSVYIPLTGATTPVLTGGDFDEGWYARVPIGFEFWFMGNLITEVHASTNGVLSLAANQPTTAASNNNLSAYVGAFYRPIIAPLWDNLDIDSLSGASFSYLTSGTEPNRVFTAEWKNAEWNWFANNATLSFQVRLYESTGVIEYVYNQENGSLFSPSASIGIGGTSNTQFLSLNNSGNSPSVSSTVSTNNINTKPASGQQYTFTPPVPTSVSAISFSNITPTAITVNWTGVTGAVKYAVYHSTDNVNFIYSGSATSNSLLVNGLFPNTTYYFKVFSISEGAYGTNPATGFSTTQNGVVSGVISIPTNAPTITSVLDSIKQYGIGGPVTIELENSYVPTFERFPITLSDTLGTSANAPLIIRPSATATNVEIYTSQSLISTILFTGARHITIDGRPGGSGTTRALTIRAASYSNAIDFSSYYVNQNNIEIKYTNIKAMTGAISIPAYIEIYGYTNNSLSNTSINNCIIGDSNFMATIGIRVYSFNQSNSVNNDISDNVIFNTGSSYNGYGISITGNYNNTWYIQRNHIFNLLSISGITSNLIYYAIGVQGANVHIKNNYIGGSDTACGGYAFEAGPAANNNFFYGIYYLGTSNQFASIQGNTIANFFWPGTSAQPWTGIHIQSGRAFIGDTIGNVIGNPQNNNTSIYVLSQTIASTPIAYGIRSLTTGAVIIKNNIISGINATGVNATYPCGINAINVTGTVQANISNNIIGSTIYPNSIRAASPNGFYPQTAIGINVSSNSFGTLNITGNTIANIGNSGTSTSLQNYASGIFVTGNLSSNINDNNIHDLFSASGNPSSNSITALVGIYYNTTSSASASISNNRIHSLRTTSTNTPASCFGINVISTSGSAITVDRNFIHSFSSISTSLLANLCGISLQEGIINATNNMIRLGVDANGNSNATSNPIIGINKITNYNTSILNNSVYIGGTVIGNAAINTYAFKKSTDGYDEIKNNIFINQRSNTATGGKHYAMGFNSINNVTSNNNLFLASGSNGRLFQLNSSDYNTRAAWFNATNLDNNSDSAASYFINATGNALNVDLHLNPGLPTKAEGNGAPTFLNEDYDGQMRSSLTPNDIGADAGNFIKIIINPVPVEWLWVKGEKDNHNAIISWKVSSQLNNQHYFVERSYDNKTFTAIHKVDGDGTLYIPKDYIFVDKDVFDESSIVIYYRITQVDYSGKLSHTKTVSVSSLKTVKEQPEMWPNPAKGKVYIKLPAEDPGTLFTITITNMSGLVVYKQKSNYQTLNELDLKSLQPGIYFTTIQIDDEIPVNKKIIIE
jgi:hypothetical protein